MCAICKFASRYYKQELGMSSPFKTQNFSRTVLLNSAKTATRKTSKTNTQDKRR